MSQASLLGLNGNGLSVQMLPALVQWVLTIKRTVLGVSGVLAVFPILVMLLVLMLVLVLVLTLVIQLVVVLVVMQLPLYRRQTHRVNYPGVCVSWRSC